MIEKELKVKPRLIEGSGGVFDVKAGSRLIYSKHVTGRFPEELEVLKALRAAK